MEHSCINDKGNGIYNEEKDMHKYFMHIFYFIVYGTNYLPYTFYRHIKAHSIMVNSW